MTTAIQDINSDTEPEPIRVVLIEDLREIREGLAILISGTNGFECAGKFRSVEEALAKIRSERPNVVLIDIGLPGVDGIEGIKVLSEKMPGVAFLVLSVYKDDERIFAALCAGACGYLLKNTPPTRLLESIREVASGGAPMSPEIARRVITLFRNFAPPERSESNLTPQEKELLKLLVEGHAYKTAALQLDISYHTASFHIRNIYLKLQVHSKSEAVAKAIHDKLV